MIDSLTLSRELTKAGLPSAHADAIATGKSNRPPTTATM